MIELNNITKVYKSKNGTDTKALDNITLKISDKGMTFILGKSGSGKSTLLNIIGGLDQYDSGDMVILGKSSKDFKPADFDSYRNTYVGFVFQEFNILEDYNVYENIVLALQLQGKPVDETEVNQLLAKLELNDLRHRKVNELSGGQKQRVAIARALIKNPKIILADEPTGNLDSKTGEQVMKLLKEISKEKLVIIVSHDKDSATTYGNRIIELKDGSIIKDTLPIDTTTNQQVYQAIKSKLPLKEGFRLGLGSLKHKKIKLAITVFLTVFTLVIFGLLDTISNVTLEKSHAKLLADRQEQFVQVEKFYYFDQGGYGNYDKENIGITENDTKLIQSKIGNNFKLYPLYKMQGESSYSYISELLHIKRDRSVRNYYLSLFNTTNTDIIETENVNDIVKEKLIGRNPINHNEIVISNVLADNIIFNGVEVPGEPSDEFMNTKIYKPKDYNELLNSDQMLYFGNKGRVKIVGIIEYDLSEYQDAREKAYRGEVQEAVEISVTNLRTKVDNIYNKIYVSNGFAKSLETEKNIKLNTNYKYQLTSNDIKFPASPHVSSAIIGEEITYYNGTEWVTTNQLKDHEMLLNIRDLGALNPDDYQKNLSAYLERFPNGDKIALEKNFFANYVKDYDVIGQLVSLKVYKARTVYYGITEADYNYENIEVVGLVGLSTDAENQYHYFSDHLVEEQQIKPILHTGYLIPMTEQDNFKLLLTELPYTGILSTKTTYSDDIMAVVSAVDQLKQIALYIAIVLLIFSIILISNFIVTSIGYRKKEIGILRALGARKLDTIKIFLWEGIILAVISGTLACILLWFLCLLFTNVILSSLIVTPFIVGIREFLDIYLLVLLVTIVSGIIPLLKISKMKPIDAILNK